MEPGGSERIARLNGAGARTNGLSAGHTGAMRPVARRRVLRALLLAGLCLTPAAAGADVLLPPGFTAQVYVTGEGFEGASGRGVQGIPGTSTLAFDETGTLYLARTGRRYVSGEADDLAPIYRIPAGGARLTPDTEARYLHGPPLRSPQMAAVRGGRELFITTFDRERKVGVLYRLADGHVELFAGGTPPRGTAPLLTQPEGAAVDTARNLYVADRDQGVVVRLDPTGRVLDPRWVRVSRPRVLAMDDKDQLWIGADGGAEAPWQQGPGEIWRVSPQGVPRLVLHGPMSAGFSVGPDGHLFVAERHAAQVLVVTPEGKRIEFATFTDGDAPRSLAFAPITPGTRRAGIAGDLFLILIRRGAWPVNEVVRIAGPFDDFVRQAR